MVSVLIAVALVSFGQQSLGPNLLANPGLVRDWDGWNPVWSREDGAAQASIVPGQSGGSRAILVKHTGSKDWAFSQKASFAVKSGELYQISAKMKVEGGTNTISVVARDSSGATIDWALGAVGPRKPDWHLVHRVFSVPAGCQSIQFRIVGTDAGSTWVQAPSLNHVGDRPKHQLKPVTLRGGGLRLVIHEDASMVATSKEGGSWNYRAPSGEYVVRTIQFIDSRTARIEALDLANDMPIAVQVGVDLTKPEATLSYEAKGTMESNIAFPGSLVTNPGQWVALPLNEGIRFPVEDASINGWSLITYGGHGLCMPWSGAFSPTTGEGSMTIIETPNDANVFFQQVDGRLTYEPRWEASRGEFSYPRKLRLCFFDHGGYVSMAKRYRDYAKATGLFKTLSAKRAESPNIDRLIGAVNIWNWDMDAADLCRELKQMGFGRVLWSNETKPEQTRTIRDLGFLPGRYDIYQDVWDPKHSLSWQPTDGWPEDLVLESNGDWMKGWAHPDKHADGTITWYQGGVISSGPGLARAKKRIPADLAKVPYMARFIDTTTASPFREDYNPAHPLTRSQDRENKMALLGFCSKDMKLVVGTETGIDPSVPYVAYYEGMMSLGPYRLPDAGTFMMEYQKPTPEFLKFQVGPGYRIPLWELVYHDCTVAQWYWGDATNKAPEVWNQRDLLNILYGTAPLLMFDKERWQRDKARMLQTYRNVCEWTRKVGYDEMISHEDVTLDHSVQRTRWSSGRSVIVNFSEKPFHGVQPMSYSLSGKQ